MGVQHYKFLKSIYISSLSLYYVCAVLFFFTPLFFKFNFVIRFSDILFLYLILTVLYAQNFRLVLPRKSRKLQVSFLLFTSYCIIHNLCHYAYPEIIQCVWLVSIFYTLLYFGNRRYYVREFTFVSVFLLLFLLFYHFIQGKFYYFKEINSMKSLFVISTGLIIFNLKKS